MAHANVVPARAARVDAPRVATPPVPLDVDVRVPLLARSNARRAAFDVAIRRAIPFAAAVAVADVLAAAAAAVVVVVAAHPRRAPLPARDVDTPRTPASANRRPARRIASSTSRAVSRTRPNGVPSAVRAFPGSPVPGSPFRPVPFPRVAARCVVVVVVVVVVVALENVSIVCTGVLYGSLNVFNTLI
jgi:hypothetical protein